MRTLLFGLALCVTCLAEPLRDVEVIVPPAAAHPQDWLHLQLRENPKPNYGSKPVSSLAEFVAPEVISKIVVDQYAGPPDDVDRYLTTMPTAAAQYFGASLELCEPPNPRLSPPYGARLDWTSTSTVYFESGRTGKLAVAMVVVARGGNANLLSSGSQRKTFGLSRAADCVGLDKVPVDSLYVNYIDPDGYSWSFALPLQRKK
jgi:hypothetical protein